MLYNVVEKDVLQNLQSIIFVKMDLKLGSLGFGAGLVIKRFGQMVSSFVVLALPHHKHLIKKINACKNS